MTYEEAVDDTTEVSAKEARREILKHGEYITYTFRAENGEVQVKHTDAWTLFVEEVGKKATYAGAEVLAWLGY